MISAKVKSLFSQLITAFQDRDLVRLDQISDEFIAPNCVWHDASTSEPFIGPEGQKQFNRTLLEANTDLKIIVNDLIEADDKMIWRASMQFKEIASGNIIHICAIEIDRIVGDQIAESWSVTTPGNW